MEMISIIHKVDFLHQEMLVRSDLFAVMSTMGGL